MVYRVAAQLKILNQVNHLSGFHVYKNIISFFTHHNKRQVSTPPFLDRFQYLHVTWYQYEGVAPFFTILFELLVRPSSVECFHRLIFCFPKTGAHIFITRNGRCVSSVRSEEIFEFSKHIFNMWRPYTGFIYLWQFIN